MLQDSGFADVVTGEAVDTFGGANGEGKARAFEVYGYAFMARRPPDGSAAAGRHRENPKAGDRTDRAKRFRRHGAGGEILALCIFRTQATQLAARRHS
jgi:hypothetical protein